MQDEHLSSIPHSDQLDRLAAKLCFRGASCFGTATGINSNCLSHNTGPIPRCRARRQRGSRQNRNICRWTTKAEPCFGKEAESISAAAENSQKFPVANWSESSSARRRHICERSSQQGSSPQRSCKQHGRRSTAKQRASHEHDAIGGECSSPRNKSARNKRGFEHEDGKYRRNQWNPTESQAMRN